METINNVETLLIAHDIGVYSRSEVQSVINNIRPEVLIGEQATLDNLLEFVINGKFKRLWFISHCGHDGIILHNSQVAHDVFIPIVRNGITEIFFNTCSSSGIAHRINNEVPHVSIIATIADIDDQHGYVIGNYVSNHIKKGRTFSESYRLSRPGTNGNYIFIPATKGVPVTKLDDVDRLIKIIDGDEGLGLPGLVNVTRVNGEKIDRQTRWMIGLFVVQVFVLMFLVYVVTLF